MEAVCPLSEIKASEPDRIILTLDNRFSSDLFTSYKLNLTIVR